jgi:replication factor A1
MDGNYEKILERVVASSGVEKEELERRVEAKRAKLSGLISKEGALQVIAAELGISFENEKLKINELLPGMRKVNLVGKVISLSPVRIFNTKKGDEGKVANLRVADDTANVKVVLWDTNHIALIEKGQVSEGTIIEITSGNMRDGEIHMGSFSEFKVSEEKIEEVKTERIIKEKKISEFAIGENVKTRAFVVQMFDPKFFEINKETGKKATEEEKVGGAEVEKRALINIVIDDGTDSIRTVLFHETLKGLGLKDLENQELLNQQKENAMGKEFFFIGNVRKNSYFNNPEFVIEGIEEPDLDKIVRELEA